MFWAGTIYQSVLPLIHSHSSASHDALTALSLVDNHNNIMLLRLVSSSGRLRRPSSVLHGRTSAGTTAISAAATTTNHTTMTMSTAASLYIKESNEYATTLHSSSYVGVADPTVSLQITKLDNGVTVLSSYSDNNTA
jgi:hypothetical protein